MDYYLNLWKKFLIGMVALIWAIVIPLLFLILEILPFGLVCLVSGRRLNKGYEYLYFLPTFVKHITISLRNRKKSVDNN